MVDLFGDHAGSSRQTALVGRPDLFAQPSNSSSHHHMSSEVPSMGPPGPAQSSNSTTSPFNTAMTESLERQPKLASGYEWDERHHSLSQGQDGTACLSVEPDGDGYLGG